MPERSQAAFPGGGKVDLLVEIGADPHCPGFREHRVHDKIRQEQREAHQQHIRWRLLQTDGLPEDGKDRDDKRKTGDHHANGRGKAEHRHQHEQLDASGRQVALEWKPVEGLAEGRRGEQQAQNAKYE